MRHNVAMRNLLKHLFLLTGIMATPAIAVDTLPAGDEPLPWYQVELVIYELNQPSVSGESWPLLTEITSPDNTVNLVLPPRPEDNEPSDTELLPAEPVLDTNKVLNPEVVAEQAPLLPRAFEQLDIADFTLAEVAEKLKRSKNYALVTHQAWQQPMREKAESPAVYITSKPLEYPESVDGTLGPELGAIENLEQPLDPVSLEVFQPAEPVAVDEAVVGLNQEPDLESNELPLLDEEPVEIAQEPAVVEGLVTVSLSRYLHMKLDLRYYNPEVYLAEQIANNNPDEAIIEYFALRESRRMRSKEVHFFDHPYFGVIATITRADRSIEAKEDAADSAAQPSPALNAPARP